MDEGCVGVVQDSPDGYEVIKLSTSLLNDTVLALKHNGHARKIFDFGIAHN